MRDAIHYNPEPDMGYIGNSSVDSDRKNEKPISGMNLMSQPMSEDYLSRAEELRLALAWRDEGDESARECLIRSHMRLASRFVARTKRRRGLDAAMDLAQEALLGLITAVDKFDPDKGYRFSTYARWWIRANVQEAIMRDNSAVRFKGSSPNRMAFFRLSHISDKAEVKLRRAGLDPTKEDILNEAARMMGMSTARLSEIRMSIPTSNSLNDIVSKHEDFYGEKIDLLACDKPNGEDVCVRNSDMSFARETLEEAFSVLDARETRIIKSRAGSLDTITLVDLARELGVSRERVRQLEIRALEKMRGKLEEMGICDTAFANAIYQ